MSKPLDHTVIIIGAGVAGLYAGYLLQKRGIYFTILEASANIGGRVGKHHFAGLDVDTGAQWLHGDLSILANPIPLQEEDIFPDLSDVKYWYQGKWRKRLPRKLRKHLDALEEGSEADISFTAFFLANGGDPADLPFVAAVAGDVGASPDNISAKWEARGYDFMTYKEEDFLFQRSYFDLINDHLVVPVRDYVQLNTVVKAVNYSDKVVQVIDEKGAVYTTEKLLITVPITVLKDNDITFEPPLPIEKTESFHMLGMEAGMKVFMRFSEHFMHENVVGGSVCASYFYENYGRDREDLVVQAYVMGNQAKILSEMGEKAALAALLEELDVMFEGQASASYIDHFIQDWYKEPFIRGAYSYPLVGSDENTRRIIAEPVDHQLFFAGEATNFSGHHQTVQGAAETAWREVMRILTLQEAEPTEV